MDKQDKPFLPWTLPEAIIEAKRSWLKRQQHPRTRKHFIPYNEYEDRPFGMKWATAYAMDELVKGIQSNHEDATKVPVALPEMTREAIDQVLQEAWLTHYPVSIQLSLKDDLGRYFDNIVGWFNGECNYFYFIIGNRKILWDDVRHIALVKESKWSHIDL
ncbi:hypothetical protein ACW66K_05235 [Aerococcus urinaeequi]|uniref:YolD-like protein n=1 Tax=Aerococcus viridans TaxID=1377 RepID=A0A2N6UCM3_9LACT|nr:MULTISPECIES: hypothetical protein [Aerococcus]OFU52277.1 hypothetical protein HMPREF3116_02495 [Aerococcus sp. HMSC10H05]PMC79312.1 hypothetical protein CJ191_07250 [Aerococcus viridans]